MPQGATNEPQTTAGAAAGPPLAGVRVLAFTHVLAGPFCARLLADLGADVVMIETRGRQDRIGATRADSTYGGRRDRTLSGLNTNRGKRSAAIDLKTPAGRAAAVRLAVAADVLVENFSADALARLKLDYAHLQPLNPRLIYVSMSGYGHDGPRRAWTSMNLNLQAYSGLMMATGREGEPPTTISNSWNDYIGGLHACFAVLDALAARARAGQGCHLDLSQFECGVATLGPLLLAASVNGVVPPRQGNRSPLAAPQGVYRCTDRARPAADGARPPVETGSPRTGRGQTATDEWCAISVQDDAQWAALLRALGDPAWGKDARFRTLAGRQQHHDEIDAHLGVWTRDLAPREAEARLREAGVPARRMRRIQEVVNEPAGASVFQPLEDPPGWQMQVTGLPFAFSRSAVPVPRPAPHLGEHTREVLAEWAGLGAAEIADLESQCVLT
ncbi:MAG TPA: CoA transferase [Chloroflexota bacterium]|jgi:crotonobetainyl-CoA:carnitine CoA-transferase CaiB-like acyl-CoA transferase